MRRKLNSVLLLLLALVDCELVFDEYGCECGLRFSGQVRPQAKIIKGVEVANYA